MNLVKFLIVETYLMFGVMFVVTPIISKTIFLTVSVKYLSCVEMAVAVVSIIYSILLEKADEKQLKKIIQFGDIVNILMNCILIYVICNSNILLYWVIAKLQLLVLTKLLTTSVVKIKNKYFNEEDHKYNNNKMLYLMPITTMGGALANTIWTLDFEVACLLLCTVDVMVTTIDFYVIKKFYT